jgi:hypothetical protein
MVTDWVVKWLGLVEQPRILYRYLREPLFRRCADLMFEQARRDVDAMTLEEQKACVEEGEAWLRERGVKSSGWATRLVARLVRARNP